MFKKQFTFSGLQTAIDRIRHDKLSEPLVQIVRLQICQLVQLGKGGAELQVECVLRVELVVVGEVDAEELVQNDENLHEVGLAGVGLRGGAEEYEKLVVGVGDQIRFGRGCF